MGGSKITISVIALLFWQDNETNVGNIIYDDNTNLSEIQISLIINNVVLIKEDAI